MSEKTIRGRSSDRTGPCLRAQAGRKCRYIVSAGKVIAVQYAEPTVGAVVLNPKGGVLLLRSHKWNNRYVIPVGHIEPGDAMEEALHIH